ncbi:hypothetical protein DLM76_21365 [Leptospira yasudae]|uniref:hypothetical protein n=1 Tax=Leptospira yasudae TaxID=2202201 RepID=UPI000EBD66A5|nr:hypothetical protein [Leptospira yasudae]RHX89498.1 hypothetical protein DLM76_21365 [Leptospira yasudae]
MKFRIYTTLVSVIWSCFVLVFASSCKEPKQNAEVTETASKQQIAADLELINSYGGDLLLQKMSDDLMEFLGKKRRNKRAYFCMELDPKKEKIRFGFNSMKEEQPIESIDLPLKYDSEKKTFTVSNAGETLYLKEYVKESERQRPYLYFSFDLKEIGSEEVIQRDRKNRIGEVFEELPIVWSDPNARKKGNFDSCLVDIEGALQLEAEGANSPTY